MKQLHKIDIGRMLTEIFLEEHIDGRLEHEGVVDGDHADVGHAEPARGAAAGVRGVHDIVRNEEEGLQEFGQPAEGGEVSVLCGVEGAAEEDGGGIDRGQAAIELAIGSVVLEGLCIIISLAIGFIRWCLRVPVCHRTCWNHSKALEGMLYCCTCSLRSLIKVG